MSKWNYSNPVWEPVFQEISPFLSKIYFAFKLGIVKYVIANMIFFKLDIIENKYRR